MCDDEAELMKSYFNSFTAEGIEQPYKLYTGSWHASTKAKYLGLPKSVFSDGESSFVLVRVAKRRGSVTAMGVHGKHLKPEVSHAAMQIRVGDDKSVIDFVKKFGSHFITQVDVGESIYQVIEIELVFLRGIL